MLLPLAAMLLASRTVAAVFLPEQPPASPTRPAISSCGTRSASPPRSKFAGVFMLVLLAVAAVKALGAGARRWSSRRSPGSPTYRDHAVDGDLRARRRRCVRGAGDHRRDLHQHDRQVRARDRLASRALRLRVVAVTVAVIARRHGGDARRLKPSPRSTSRDARAVDSRADIGHAPPHGTTPPSLIPAVARPSRRARARVPPAPPSPPGPATAVTPPSTPESRARDTLDFFPPRRPLRRRGGGVSSPIVASRGRGRSVAHAGRAADRRAPHDGVVATRSLAARERCGSHRRARRVRDDA